MVLVIGIDSSTQSTKVEVVDVGDGTLVASARSPHPATTPPASEQWPTDWWRALLDCLAEVDHHLPSIEAVAVAGQQHGLVTLDESDQPVRPAKLWNDTTSAPQSARLVATVGGERWAQWVGSVPGPSFTITKLAWMAEQEPDSLARTVRIGLPHDYLNYQLTHRWVTDRGEASGTGYWSPESGSYVDEALRAAGVDPAAFVLPRIANPFESIGSVSHPDALQLGLSPDALVAPGTGDNMAAALGLGVGPGDLVMSLGTSGTAYAVSNDPTSDPTGLVSGFADAAGRFLPLICTLNATKVTEAVRSLLGIDYDEFDALALSAPQGAAGLTLVPYFDGERTPNRPDATGALTGIRTDVTRPQVARAAVEGVVCGLLDGVDALLDCGVRVHGRRFFIGGGARSAAFRACLAALSEHELVIPSAEETVARGAAVQAACVLTGEQPATVAERWGLGQGYTVEVPEPVGEPVAEVRARYRNEAATR